MIDLLVSYGFFLLKVITVLLVILIPILMISSSTKHKKETDKGRIIVTKNLIRNINNRLRKNWRILEALNPEQKTKTTRTKLIEKGFDFNYFTSIYTTKAGTIYYFVYDQGYLPLDNDFYALVKRQ